MNREEIQDFVYTFGEICKIEEVRDLADNYRQLSYREAIVALMTDLDRIANAEIREKFNLHEPLGRKSWKNTTLYLFPASGYIS